MDKRLVFPQNSESERDIFFVKEDRNYLVKKASEGAYHPEVQKYIKDAKPLPGLVQVLLTALGAYPTWPQNVNGDRFYEQALSHRGQDYGVDTFLSNANYFTHHVNKDPALAKGKVLHAVWNEKAKRVELVVGIDVSLDPEAVAAVDRGDSLCFSMGCKVPFDVCSICGNRAQTRAQYCEHLKYMMNQMDPSSGQLVGALNTLPKFFDISRVLIPADKTAYMWTKIAAAGNPYRSLSSAAIAELPPGKIADIGYLTEKVAELREIGKQAASTKSATITKRIEAKTAPSPKVVDNLEKIVPPARAMLEATSPDFPKAALDSMVAANPDLSSILSTLFMLGMPPRDHEVLQLDRRVPTSPEKLRLAPELYSREVADAAMPFIGMRSFARPILVERIVILANRLEDGKDKEIQKVAETVSAQFKRETDPKTVPNTGAVAGILAALYLLMKHQKGESLMNPGHLVGSIVAAAIGAGMLQAARSMDTRGSTGIYSVDDDTRFFYNNDWQSRFARMQARPVTVIKTGSAEDRNKALWLKMMGGTAGLMASSAYLKSKENEKPLGPVAHYVAHNPDVVGAGILAEHVMGGPITKKIKELVDSGKRVVKTASIRDLEFISSVPEEGQELVWDLAVLDAAGRIKRHLLGG